MINVNRIGCLLFLMATMLVFTLNAQPSSGEAGSPVPRVIPPSPEASSLGKFAEQPVSLYTGVPDISLPLFNISKGPLSLGVGLSYHGSGIRVEEMASWVGSGWSLNAGGVVTRTVRGKPDDNTGAFGTGFLAYRELKSVNIIAGSQSYLTDLTEGTGDAEPDSYFVNANGITAQFTFNWDGNIRQSEPNKLKIVPVRDSGSATPARIIGWDITDDGGIKYKFREMETTNADPGTAVGPARNGTYASSWYLSEITDYNNENSIYFTYDSYTLDHAIKNGVSIRHALATNTYNCLGYPGSISSSNTRMITNGKRVSEIRTHDNSTKIKFYAGANRTDTEQLTIGGSSSNFRMLDRVELQNSSGNPLKSFKFDYGYSTNRLTLLSVTPQHFSSGAYQNTTPPFAFTYCAGALPSPLSKGQDHWGYYNGKDGNTYLVPATIVKPMDGQQWIKAVGGDRSPHGTHMLAGSLRKIIYPTGGYTEFDFEAHQFGFVQNTPLSYSTKQPVNFGVTAAESEISSGTSTTKTVNFTINPDPIPATEGVPVTISWAAFTDAVTGPKKPSVKLLNSSNNEIIGQIFGMQSPNADWSGNAFIALMPGAYRLEVTCHIFGEINDYASIEVEFDQFTGNIATSKIAGGLRVKEIRQFESANDPTYITRQFKYVTQGEPSRSSGVIYQEPLYEYFTTTYCKQNINLPTGNSMDIPVNNPTLVRLANNVTSLGTTQGSHIGYREVEIIYGRGSQLNGKTFSTFTSPFDFPDNIYWTLPFRPADSKGYRTGLLKQQTDFKYDNGSYSPVSKTENTYTFFEESIEGLASLFLGTSDAPYYLSGSYLTNLGRARLAETQVTTYPTTGALATTTTTEYEYTPTLSHTRKVTTHLANGDKLIKEYCYLSNISTATAPPIQSSMIVANMVGTLIEELEIINKGGADLLRKGRNSVYALESTKIRLDQVLELNPEALSGNFVRNSGKSWGTRDGRYKLAVDYSYNNFGNLTQLEDVGAVTKSFVWGYQNEYPIAEVNGAASNQIFHTSFEEDGSPEQAKTGSRAYSGSTYTVPIANRPVGTNLVMTYWYFTNGTWNFQPEIPYNQTFTVAGASYIDEVRIYPIGAQMTTYTYDPLIGRTSTTDANNQTTSFVYDVGNRLIQVKDSDGFIKKSLDYRYRSN